MGLVGTYIAEMTIIPIILYCTMLFISYETAASNILLNKLLLFVGIFLLQMFITVCDKAANKCKINGREIANNSLITAAVAVIGYSLYIDCFLMAGSKYYIDLLRTSKISGCAIITAIIATTLGVYKLCDGVVRGYTC
ncbi:MAG: hypothetical protein Faunusvirus52_10 [Faunusvirus sp.]|jgi:hypothetical protein|uniref:Uncharacterized protein n=1 Tax=Faunusvirus sp. TaxID=2487766 RepID=A0A3G5A1Q9_9VIRU|nr:MAG: hypothetical protein Faunusvirus52_10 [Faunusvirus sp.]